MLFLREFTVRKHERGLLFKNGDFERFLAPSTYRFFDPRKRVEVERYDLSRPAFEHRLLDFLIRWYPEEIDAMFVKVETGPSQLAVICENGRPATVVGPGRRALFWKGVVRVTAELIDITIDPVVAPRLARIIVGEIGTRHNSAFEHAALVREVPEGHIGLLYVDGQIADELAPGLHVLWKFTRGPTVDVVDLRVKTLEIVGQEVLTKDKIPLRVSLNASYRFVDARKAVTAVEDPLALLRKEIQFGLRAAAGTRTLDALHGDQGAVDLAVLEYVRAKLAGIGLEIRDVGVRHIALEHNPIAVRLRELDALEKITDKVGNISVQGEPGGVLSDFVRIRL